MALRKEYDEQMLAKVLEAAYVLQEHGQELRSLKDEGVAGAEKPGSPPAPSQTPTRTTNDVPVAGGPTTEATATFLCRKCGHELIGDEQYCAKCGAPRSGREDAPSLQSKVASLWHMQQERERTSVSGGHKERAEENLDSVREGEQRVAEDAENSLVPSWKIPVSPPSDLKDAPETIDALIVEGQGRDAQHTSDDIVELKVESPAQEDLVPSTALQSADAPAALTSAAKARDFLEQVAVSQRRTAFARFWNSHRGDIYLAVAVVLFAWVIRWSVFSHPVSANLAAKGAHHRMSQDANLSLFEKLLVSLGIAEAPDAAADKGNPNTQVWIDLQTALYYCPGTDLYGKTVKGKFTSQRDAQLDQFEPAYREACR